MTRHLCCALLAALLALAAHAAPTVQPTAPKPNPLKIEDTKAFFNDFLFGHFAPKKSEFETDEAYEKRLPKYTQGTVNFVVTLTSLPNNKRFSYKIDTQTLTFYGGSFGLLEGIEEIIFTNHQQTIRFFSTETLSTREATSDFGVKYTVKKCLVTYYAFCFVNFGRIPAEYLCLNKDGGLAFTLNYPPKEAEALSKTVEIIFCVRPIDYRRSVFSTIMYLKPKIDLPEELLVNEELIEASLVKVILRNKDTKAIIAQYDIPQNEDAPAAPATPAP